MSDIVIEDDGDMVQVDYLKIIDSQLGLISTVVEYPDDVYDNMAADKIKTIAKAFRIIIKTQNALFEAI